MYVRVKKHNEEIIHTHSQVLSNCAVTIYHCLLPANKIIQFFTRCSILLTILAIKYWGKMNFL